MIEAMQSLVQTQPELTILPGDDTPLVRDRYLSRNELIERLSNYVDLCVMYAESAVRHESAQLHGDREEVLRKETHEETLMQRLSSNIDKLLAHMQRDIRFRKANRKIHYPTPKINPRIAPPVSAHLKLMQQLYHIVAYNLAKSRTARDGNRILKRKNFKPKHLKRNGLVLVRDHTSKAFEPKAIDHHIVDFCGKNQVLVKDNHGNKKKVHVKDVKPIEMDIATAEFFRKERE